MESGRWQERKDKVVDGGRGLWMGIGIDRQGREMGMGAGDVAEDVKENDRGRRRGEGRI